MVAASADVNPKEAVLDPIFDDKTNRRRVTGPVEYAIDGKDETAWGIDLGPGLRNQPRKAVFVAETPIGLRGGTLLHVYLKQNHGGWNSDDNQNYNLGRLRVSVTTAPQTPSPTRCRAAVRAGTGRPEDRRTPAQEQAVFSLLADHRPGMGARQRPRSPPSGASIPRARPSSC